MTENRPLFLFIESSTCGIGEVFARKAHELGYAPMLIASDPHKYDFNRHSWLSTSTCDTYDSKQLAKLISDLRSHANIAGIYSSSEFFLAQSAKLAHTLGLPAPNPQMIDACRDKIYSRRVIATCGIDDLEFSIARTPDEAAIHSVKSAGPLMIGPSRGSGPGRIKICENETQTKLHVAKLLLSTPDMSFLVEDYAPGQVYSVQLFDGLIYALVAKHLDLTTHYMEIGYDFPALISAELAQRLSHFALACVKALGMTWGPAYVELRSDGQYIHLTEIHPRLVGGMLPFMIQAAGGPDFIKATILKATRHAYCLDTDKTKSAALRFIMAHRHGTLVQVRGINAAQAIPSIESVQIYYELPLTLLPTNNVLDIIGHVLSVNSDTITAVESIEQAMSCLTLEVEDAELPILH